MIVRAAERAKPDWQILCVSWAEAGRQSSLSELWLVSFKDRKPFRAQAENRRAIYLSTGFVVHPESRAKYDRIMDDRRLDAVVVDMKDDFGRLRFEPRDPTATQGRKGLEPSRRRVLRPRLEGQGPIPHRADPRFQRRSRL